MSELIKKRKKVTDITVIVKTIDTFTQTIPVIYRIMINALMLN